MSNNLQLHNSKLVLLLRTLDKKEVKQFDLWLSSPFHNNSEKVLNLYRGLMNRGKGSNKPISKIILAKHIGISDSLLKNNELSPKEDTILRKVMNQLTTQIQEFLIWQKSKENKIHEKRLLMDALLERKLYPFVPAILTKSKKELAASPYRDIQHYENTFEIVEIDIFLDVLLTSRSSKTHILQKIIDVSLQSAIARVIRYYCAAKNREQILKIEHNYPLIKAIKEYIDKELKDEVPIIWAYYIVLCMIEEGKEQHFYKLKKYIFNNLAFFDIIDIRQFFALLINYCIKAIKIGKVKFIQEKQEVYELGLELNCWTTRLYFSTHQFVNIVYNATVRLNKTDWVNNFIQQYQAQLNPDIKDDILNYCYALVAFQIKDYNAAQDYLIKINNTEDFIYHLRFKVLFIKIYYERAPLTIENIDRHPINYKLDAIRHYVMSTRNKKMSESSREAYNNFVNLFKRILNRKKKIIHQEPVKAQQIQKLKKDLATEIPFVERQWLKEKVEELT